MQMENVLTWLGTFPGVIGSLVATRNDGHVLARAFPDEYTPAGLEAAAEAVADAAAGLQKSLGCVENVAFRYGDLEVLGRLAEGTMLMVLARRRLLGQQVLVALSVAERTLARLRANELRPAPTVDKVSLPIAEHAPWQALPVPASASPVETPPLLARQTAATPPPSEPVAAQAEQSLPGGRGSADNTSTEGGQAGGEGDLTPWCNLCP